MVLQFMSSVDARVAMAAFTCCGLMATGFASPSTVSVFNLDSTHYTREFGDDKMNEKGLRAYIHRVLREGAFTHFFICPGSQTTLCDSKIVSPMWWSKDVAGGKMTESARCYYMMHTNGIDVINVEIDAVRKHGVSPWLSIRMNDNHHSNDPSPWLHSRFWIEHPEYRKQGGLDYSIQAVQDYNLAFIAEMLERYDVDGIECDWMRWPIPHPAKVLTNFMRRVRTVVDSASKERGHPVFLGVRVASRPGRAVANGTDAVEWACEGLVDWIVPANFFASVDFELPVAEWKKRCEKAGGSPLIVPCADSGVVVRNPTTGQLAPRRMLSLAEYCGWARRMWEGGADGVYFFNLFTFFEKAYPVTETEPWDFIIIHGLTPEALKGRRCSIPENWWYEP